MTDSDILFQTFLGFILVVAGLAVLIAILQEALPLSLESLGVGILLISAGIILVAYGAKTQHHRENEIYRTFKTPS